LIKPQQIKPLTERENKIVEEMPALQEQIEKTKSDIVWQ
jgi:peptidoglycan hydrolase CwlO-like protein